jgi:hypothetical protein
VVLSGREDDVGFEALSYVRRALGDRRISNAKPSRWNALNWTLAIAS